MVEHRRSHRKRAQQAIQVTNAITGEPLGYIGNLSTDGMLLIGSRTLPDDALFQVTFQLPNGTARPHLLEVGIHEQWGEAANIPGQYWSGFRIIDIGPEDYAALADWISVQDDHYV